MKPAQPLSAEFISDCTIGIMYQIHNHCFPFPANEVKEWKITDNDIAFSLANIPDTFMSKWIRKTIFRPKHKRFWIQVKTGYKSYFANLNQLRTNEFKIETQMPVGIKSRQSLKDHKPMQNGTEKN